MWFPPVGDGPMRAMDFYQGERVFKKNAGSCTISAGDSPMPHYISDPVDIPRLQQIVKALPVFSEFA